MHERETPHSLWFGKAGTGTLGSAWKIDSNYPYLVPLFESVLFEM
jgi:hypothetical protein